VSCTSLEDTLHIGSRKKNARSNEESFVIHENFMSSISKYYEKKVFLR